MVKLWTLKRFSVSPTCQKQDHNVIQKSYNKEAVNEGVGIIAISVMNAACHNEIKIIPPDVSGDNLLKLCLIVNKTQHFVTFLLLRVLRPICCVQPCQGGDF